MSKADTVRIVLLKHDDDASWAYVPQVCDRIRAFCRTYESDADPEQIVRVYHACFLADEPQVIAIVAVQEGKIIGHLLVSMDTWMGAKVATILQYEHDHGVSIPADTLQKTFAWLRTWARERGAGRLQALVRDPRLGKAFMTNYGFQPKAMILYQDVED